MQSIQFSIFLFSISPVLFLFLIKSNNFVSFFLNCSKNKIKKKDKKKRKGKVRYFNVDLFFLQSQYFLSLNYKVKSFSFFITNLREFGQFERNFYFKLRKFLCHIPFLFPFMFNITTFLSTSTGSI